MKRKGGPKKKVSLVKTKKVTTPPSSSPRDKNAVLSQEDLEEGAVAKELLEKRSTSEFSRNELSALMQTAPGGAEPHHVKNKSRQFNRQVGYTKPAGVIKEGRTSGNQSDFDDIGRRIKRPGNPPILSDKNYKIDSED